MAGPDVKCWVKTTARPSAVVSLIGMLALASMTDKLRRCERVNDYKEGNKRSGNSTSSKRACPFDDVTLASFLRLSGTTPDENL